MATTSSKLTLAKQLIEEGQKAELARDVEAFRQIFSLIGPENEAPQYAFDDEAVNAELYRLHGVFFTLSGLFFNRVDFQRRAKNCLTEAIILYEQLGNSIKAAESQVNLAFCYFNLDEKDNAKALLSLVEQQLAGERNPVFLQAKINQMLLFHFWAKYDVCLEIYDDIKSAMDGCDHRLQGMFFTQAGNLFSSLNSHDRAIDHLHEAIRFGELAGDNYLIGSNYNNLAFLYKNARDFEKATMYVALAIERFESVGQFGNVAHVLDTRAGIEFESGATASALVTIDESIRLFYQGEDFRGLTEALSNKVTFLLSLEKSADALATFAELHEVAKTQIGDAAARGFLDKFHDALLVGGGPLFEAEHRFRERRLRREFDRHGNRITDTARALGLSHQTLRNMLDNQFPALAAELGIKRTVREKPRTVALGPHQIHQETIKRIDLAKKRILFDFAARFENFETFYCDVDVMSRWGLDDGAIVAVIPIELEAGKPVMVRLDGALVCETVQYDSFTGIYFIDTGVVCPLDDEIVVGEPVGFCPISQADKNLLRFSRL